MTRAKRSKRRVSDLCEIMSSKRIFAADYQAHGVPFFRGKEITEKYYGAIEVSTELFIARSKFEEIKAKSGAPMPGDLLLTSVGTLGSTYVVRRGDEFYFKDGNITWFRDFRGLDSKYFNYWLTAPDGRAELKKCTIGSSQSAYTIILLKGMEIEMPSLAEQRRIASILSAYDDLIENNTRRIAILEEMARRIYEEWFVRFRFPGHEGVRMVESELGLVPEGWRVKEVKDVVLRLPAGTVYKEANVLPEGRVPVVDQSISELLGFHNGQPAHRASAETPVVIFGDHTCKMQLMVTPFSLGPNTVAFASKELPVHYVFAVVRGLVTTHEYKRHWTDLMKKKVVVGASSVATAFADAVRPMAELTEALRRKNRNLRTTRDLLLPKLISGELDVSAAPEPQALAA